MNIRFFRSGSVPIWISTLELQVQDTCHLHNMKYWKRYENTTYRLHELHL